MPWYRIAYLPKVVSDLAQIDTATAQRLLDKTKWLASNAGNLRHDPHLQAVEHPPQKRRQQHEHPPALGDFRRIERQRKFAELRLYAPAITARIGGFLSPTVNSRS